MPQCKINGRDIEVKQGTTIMEAFYKLEEEIAHYCYHPGLSIAGVCRLCMVEIEGNPKIQIACNTEVQEGMVISNKTDTVKEAVRWGLDFHLINHPLDCPICDQSGECELQIQYMKFGRYEPDMAKKKVKKRKVIDLGSKIVLDSERCILCSRCVRFTDEVSKTHELGIFNRGDHSEIGTFKDKPLENKYALNTVDICPVGALTSKDFRFRQRVWYLKSKPTLCSGCSTGCSVNAYYNEEGVFRLRPKYNKDVNGHWMCDEGRLTYKSANISDRLRKARVGEKGHLEIMNASKALMSAKVELEKQIEKGKDTVALVLTGSYTNEEYDAILSLFSQTLKIPHIFHWENRDSHLEDFDGILLRNDRSPNTKGLLNALKKYQITPQNSWEGFSQKKFHTAVVMGPENQSLFKDFKEKVKMLDEGVENLIWFTAGQNKMLSQMSCYIWQIPLKVHFEKQGTFTNHSGLEQKFQKVCTLLEESYDLVEVAKILNNEKSTEAAHHEEKIRKTNYFTQVRGSL